MGGASGSEEERNSSKDGPLFSMAFSNAQLDLDFPNDRLCLDSLIDYNRLFSDMLNEQPTLEAWDSGPHNSQCFSDRPSDVSGAVVKPLMGGTSGSEVDSDQSLEDLSDPSSNLPVVVHGNSPHVLEALALRSDPSVLQASATRERSKNWSEEEKLWYMVYKRKAVKEQVGKGKEWDYISRRLEERKIFRDATKCENFWGTALKGFRAKKDNKSSSWSKFLPEPCYKLMQEILEARRGADHAGSSHTVHPIVEEAQGSQSIAEQLGADHAGPSHMMHLVAEEDDDNQLRCQKVLELYVKKRSVNAVNSDLEPLLECRFHEAGLQDGIGLISPEFKQTFKATVFEGVKVRVLDNLKFLAYGWFFNKDDPIAGLAPTVEKFIKDALKVTIESAFPDLKAIAQMELKRQKIELDKQKVIRQVLDRQEKKRLKRGLGLPTKRSRKATGPGQ